MFDPKAVAEEVEANNLWRKARLLEQLETERSALGLRKHAVNFATNSALFALLAWIATGSLATIVATSLFIWLVEVRFLQQKRFAIGLEINRTVAEYPDAPENAALCTGAN
jgi:hypothetical protein